MDAELSERLTRVEALLQELLRECRAKRKQGAKRARTIAEHTTRIATTRATDIERAKARKIMKRLGIT